MNDNVQHSTAQHSIGRIGWIDALKGFASLTVVLGHIADGYTTAGMFEKQQSILLAVYNAIYAFHMPLYFMISGFVFSAAYLKPGDRRRRIGRQMINILITYFLWSILLGVMKMIFAGNVNKAVRLADLLWIPIKAIDPYWYLYVLLLCYVITTLLAEKGDIWLAVCAVSAVCCLAQYWILRTIPGITMVSIFAYYFFFAFGVLISTDKVSLTVLARPISILLHFAVGITLAVMFLSGVKEKTSWATIPFWGGIMAYALSAALLGSFMRFYHAHRFRALELIGRYSLEIYLMHCFITAGNRVVLPKLGIASFLPCLFINFIMATVIPILTATALKKLGLHEIIFRPATWYSRRKNGGQ